MIVYGILRIFDMLVDEFGIIPPSLGAERLELLYKINNRLPSREIESRVIKWKTEEKSASGHTGCPGHQMHRFDRPRASSSTVPAPSSSQLGQWPCQIKLVPVNAPYFQRAKLLIAADCTAFAYANLHQDFMRGKITLIGCPKLDGVDYSEKLTQILRSNDIQSVTIVRMEVPCCGGLELAAQKALQASGKFLPWQVVTISIDGKILD